MHAQLAKQLFELGQFLLHRLVFLSKWSARKSDMIKQAARTSIRCMHRTHKAPSFRKQFSDSRGFHFGEVLASVNTAEMG